MQSLSITVFPTLTIPAVSTTKFVQPKPDHSNSQTFTSSKILLTIPLDDSYEYDQNYYHINGDPCDIDEYYDQQEFYIGIDEDCLEDYDDYY